MTRPARKTANHTILEDAAKLGIGANRDHMHTAYRSPASGHLISSLSPE